MTVPERFYQFMAFKKIRPRWVEMECGISNGYLGKQRKNNGSFGGNILRKIEKRFPELNITWLISGEGDMITTNHRGLIPKTFSTVEEESASYGLVVQEIVPLLKQQISNMESALQDKQKLINILENQLKQQE